MLNNTDMSGGLYLQSFLKNKKDLLYFSTAAVLAAVHIVIILLIRIRMPYFLDSDMSSELLLSRILSEEHSLMSKNWFYSTELRVLNTQLVYTFFFNFTNSWHRVRLLSDAVLHCSLSGSVIFFCRKAGIKRYSFCNAICAVSSLSVTYFLIIAMGCYYIPHIAISFLTLALAFMSSESGKKKKISALTVLSLLSFAAGAGGVRQLVITYLPLTAAVMILCCNTVYREGMSSARKSAYSALIPAALTSLLSGGAGCIVNSRVLSGIYHFKEWDTIRFKQADPDRISQVIFDLLTSLGFTTGDLTVKNLVSNCCFGILLLLTLWAVSVGLRQTSGSCFRLLTVFFICNTAVFILLYTLTDMPYTARYNFPVIIFSFPLITMAIHEADLKMMPAVSRQILSFILMGSVLIKSGIVHSDLRNFVKTPPVHEVAEFINNSDYRYGYATFWNGNVLTELTNGKAEMYLWRSSGNDGSEFSSTKDPDDLYEWLQKTEHVTSPPDGKVFVLYRKNEIEHCGWKEHILPEDLIFETEEYEVYGFESHDEMMSVYTTDNNK